VEFEVELEVVEFEVEFESVEFEVEFEVELESVEFEVESEVELFSVVVLDGILVTSSPSVIICPPSMGNGYGIIVLESIKLC
jgi:hypothetical protein